MLSKGRSGSVQPREFYCSCDGERPPLDDGIRLGNADQRYRSEVKSTNFPILLLNWHSVSTSAIIRRGLLLDLVLSRHRIATAAYVYILVVSC
jgi:hypothetical protein